ncbi:MAG: SAM-dependent methyltransferase [Eubacteriales bacterium]|nr:SAM-dependent methyltransferase [Eubacteriales bacterium]
MDDCIRDENLGDKEFNIIDFGCGKSYLTFIVYYYFSEIKHVPVRMTGLDLKEDVIVFCNGLAEKYGYDKLNFIAGDIAKYDMSEPVDMMISLHACDTATDYALYNAIVRGVRFILSVPCCQHELNTNADFGKMSVLNDSGILRERAASLFTDGIRAKMLTFCSYKTQLMEFVDLSHTPKNILIRAKKALIPESTRQKALMDAEELLGILNTEQTLHKLLIERKRE